MTFRTLTGIHGLPGPDINELKALFSTGWIPGPIKLVTGATGYFNELHSILPVDVPFVLRVYERYHFNSDQWNEWIAAYQNSPERAADAWVELLKPVIEGLRPIINGGRKVYMEVFNEEGPGDQQTVGDIRFCKFNMEVGKRLKADGADLAALSSSAGTYNTKGYWQSVVDSGLAQFLRDSGGAYSIHAYASLAFQIGLASMQPLNVLQLQQAGQWNADALDFETLYTYDDLVAMVNNPATDMLPAYTGFGGFNAHHWLRQLGYPDGKLLFTEWGIDQMGPYNTVGPTAGGWLHYNRLGLYAPILPPGITPGAYYGMQLDFGERQGALIPGNIGMMPFTFDAPPDTRWIDYMTRGAPMNTFLALRRQAPPTTPEEKPVIVTTGCRVVPAQSEVNVRREPKISSARLVTLLSGQGLKFVETVTGDVYEDITEWHKVEYNSEFAYIHSKYGKKVDCEAAPDPDPTPDPNPDIPPDIAVIVDTDTAAKIADAMLSLVQSSERIAEAMAVIGVELPKLREAQNNLADIGPIVAEKIQEYIDQMQAATEVLKNNTAA